MSENVFPPKRVTVENSRVTVENSSEVKNKTTEEEKEPFPIHCLPILWGTHSAMDFSQFRETGELSDITVVIDESEFHLHKFPLYIKSDFFKEFASNTGTDEKDRVELDEFPGGIDIFKVVANYCYNIKIDIRRDNVCKVRCAAEYLQMNSTGNLADLADRYLQDTLTSAKLARSLGTIVDLLLQCNELGTIAVQAGLVDRCIQGIVDCWLMSTKHRPSRIIQGTKNPPAADGLQKLTGLPLNWFLQLLVTARDKSVRPAVLASLAQMYIDKAMDKISQGVDEKVDRVEAENNEEDKTQEDTGAKDDDTKKSESEFYKIKYMKQNQQEISKKNNEKADAEIGEILDALLLELPEGASLADTISPQWAARMLQSAQSMGCKSRPLLLKLAGRLLPKLTPSDLHDMSPALLCEMVQQVGTVDETCHTTIDNLSKSVDNYLLELADKQELTVDVLCQLVSALPAEKRSSHDTLYKVVESILKSEKLNLDEDEKQKLLDLIDFQKLSELSLQRAYEAEIFPTNYVTKAALDLCSRLRAQLDTASDVIRSQETELTKFGLGGRGSSWLKKHDPDHAVPASKHSFPHTISSQEYVSSTEAALTSAQFDYNLALEDIDSKDTLPAYHSLPSNYFHSTRTYQPGQFRSTQGGSSPYLEDRELQLSTSPQTLGTDYYRKSHRPTRWYSARH